MKRRINNWASLATVAMVLLTACHTTRVVEPLEQGEWQVGGNIGGPFVNGGLLPMTSIHAAHGLKESLSLFGGIQTTTLAFQTLQLDLGAHYGLLKPNGAIPGVGVNGVLNPMIGFRDGDFRLYPEFNPVVYWQLGNEALQHHVFLSQTSWFDLHTGKRVYNKGTLWHPAYSLGYQLKMSQFQVTLEARWIKPGSPLLIPQAEVNQLGNGGGYGVYLSFAFRFNKKS